MMVKIKGVIIRETDKAMYVAAETTDGILAHPRWIPKSCSYVMERTPKEMDVILVKPWLFKRNFAKQDIEVEE